MRGLDRLAVEVTGRIQTGSLPLHVSTILIVVVALPGGVLLLSGLVTSDLRMYDSAGQIAAAVLISIAAVWATTTRGRLKAFMLLGVVGTAVMLTPVLVFLSAAVRTGGEQRDRRLAALRLMGADHAATRRITRSASSPGTSTPTSRASSRGATCRPASPDPVPSRSLPGSPAGDGWTPP